MKRLTGNPTAGRRVLAGLALLALAGMSVAASEPLEVDRNLLPPWSTPLVSGPNLTVPGIDDVPDLHGDITDPQLVVFFAGNQYMLVNELLRAFRKSHPEVQRVFAETLPPGRLVQQMTAGSLVIGNMRIRLAPDVFTAGRGRVAELQKDKQWFGEITDYARNRLAIMTYRGNPEQIHGWQDLARPDLAICMPNPTFEGIAAHAIIPALRKAGGNSLVERIYQQKVKAGSTFLTEIHHRQTPIRIMERRCAAGAVWYTEAYFHSKLAAHPIDMVTVADAQNQFVTYTAAVLKRAPHPDAARAFLGFLMSAEGQSIYRKYGFLPPPRDGS